MTEYSVISKFRNKEAVEKLVEELRRRGKSCYNFCDTPADPTNPDASPEEQMQVFEQDGSFFTNEHSRHVFEKDLAGLKNSEKVIMLLPAGNSVHIEAGIAYALGKPVILIGEPEKHESLYFIFAERYKTIEEFLASL